jgi:hypothetical protein
MEKHSSKKAHSNHKSEPVHKKKKQTYDIWKIVSFVLLVLLVISIITSGFKLSMTKEKTENLNVMSKEEVGTKSVEYIKKLVQGQTVKLNNVSESNGLYILDLNVAEQRFTSYASKDGKILFAAGYELDVPLPNLDQQQQQPAQDIPKSDKPQVEVFVMSHCPYGTQIEKGIIPVIKTLKDKADIQIKFVSYAMHGETEVVEQLNQFCINEVYPAKFIDYLECFLEAGNAVSCMEKTGISQNSLSSCKENAEKEYKLLENLNDPQKTEWQGNFPPFNIHKDENLEYGVRGSPTLVINGQVINSARDAQNLLNTVCAAFNTEPSECSIDLSEYGTPNPGFGWDNSGAAASTAGGCGA